MKIRQCCSFINKMIAFVFLLLFAFAAHADQPWSTTVDGRLFVKGTTTPLTKNVAFKLQIVNPAGTCILYEENQSYDTTLTNGYFNLKVGTNNPDSTSLRSLSDPGFAMTKIFNNVLNSFPVSATCPAGYVPSAGDSRYLRVTIQPAGDPAEVLSPNIALNSVPSAQVANSLSGLRRGDVLQVNTASGVQLDQSNLESIFNSTQLPILNSLLAGTSSLYEKHASNGTTTIPAVASPSSPSAGQMWYDSGVLKYYNGTATQTLGTAGAGLQSITAGAGLLGGTINSTGTIDVDVGTTAGKIVQLDGTAKLPAVDGSALTNLNGSAITSGTIGGTTAVNTSGNITTTGNVTAQNVSATGANFRSLTLTNATSQSLVLQPPVSITGSPVTFTLPGTTGSANQVLTTNGAGVLTWTTPTAATVTNVSGTAPIQVASGTTAPVISVDAATTSASGVVTLAANGGTTAGTVVQADDSRLTNVRSPIGTALNSAQMWVGSAGNVATAVTMSGDATLSNAGALTLANSGATAGTYTKVTVDAKGRVTGHGVTNLTDIKSTVAGNWFTATGACSAGEQLSYSSVADTLSCQTFALTSSQVTTALGFTPANGTNYVAKAGDTMTGALNLPSNGLAVGTSQLVVSGGNVGIGTTSPSGLLSVGATSQFTVDSSGNITAPGVVSSLSSLTTGGSGTQYTIRRNVDDNLLNIAGGSSSVLGGNIILNGSTSATNPNVIRFRNSSTEAMRIDASGNVGIGTTSPGSGTRLNVEGQIRAGSASISTGAINFSSGNTIVTSYDCSSNLTFSDLRDGGSYTLVVTDAGTAQCSFSTTTTGDGAATVSYRFKPANTTRTVLSHTIYSIFRAGDVVYVGWSSGW